MFQKVFHDYWASLRWGRVKKVYGNFNGIWLITYLLIVFPVMMRAGESGSEGIIQYYTGVIPILYCVYSLSLVAIRLPKQMLLCPLDGKERKKYLLQTFFIRLFIPVLLDAAGCLVLYLIHGWNVPGFMGISVFSIFSVTLCGSITTWPGSMWMMRNAGAKEKKKERLKDERLKGLYPVSIIGICVGLFSKFSLILFFEIWGLSGGGYVILWSILLGGQVIFDLLTVRYLKPVVEIAADYEKTYLS